MHAQVNKFDANNKELIYNLLVLKGEALLKGQFLAMRKEMCYGEEYCNFFTAISDQIDTLLIYFLNDEISASLDERGPLRSLIEEVKKDHYIDEHFKRLQYAESDLPNLFANKTDFIIGSNLLDFKVNTFSAFKKSIDEGRFYKFDTKLDQRLYLRRIYKGEKEIIGKDKQGYFTRWNEMANLDEDTYRELENAVLKNEIHEVEWKTNRLVIANNFTLLHRRTPFKYESGERVIFRAYVQ